jgi:hypothetical protein
MSFIPSTPAEKWLISRGFSITPSEFEPTVKITFIEHRPGVLIEHFEVIQRENIEVYAKSKGWKP